MYYSFIRYFFSYIVHAKTRQRLLFIAVFGLFLSSLSLLIIQSTMNGLQRNLVTRSKSILGDHLFELKNKLKTSQKCTLFGSLNTYVLSFQFFFSLFFHDFKQFIKNFFGKVYFYLIFQIL